MNKINLAEVQQYVEENIGKFHEKRIASLDKLNLNTVLRKKNPYLFRAKHLLTAEQIVRSLTDAFISSNEETIFGDWLEGLAIFVNSKAFGGRKSGISGIDLEFDRDGRRYIVTIKSGPSWGNASQIAKMKSDFTSATKTLRTSGSGIEVVAVNGCCYGKNSKPDRGYHYKYCGQKFWEFISGDADLYTLIIEPLGYKAGEKNELYLEAYARKINQFTLVFAEDFCLENGAIDWHKMVQFNSSAERLPKKARRR